MWISITDLGDSAVGLTLAALVLVVLLAAGWVRGAVAWLIAVVGCGAVTGAVKVVFAAAAQGCGTGASASAGFSPSGHVALSTVVYGGLAVLGARQVPSPARIPLGAACAVLLALIATSRIAIQAHTPIEVATGLAVGLGAVAVMIYMLWRSSAPPYVLPQLVVALVLALAWMYGTHWPVEENLHRLA
ncbi:MAG TPA: phosphatase PAP2 family protein, partial [Burkholderiaceae bacterium]|nr:phosphatase PAP2 family protein [Burkholderiaceae bacterium]